ncbi:Rv3235 family protein [Streptomyces sp. NPDC017940]|uniref:Rv3235 family protein n=1 Tax=Streptomyces sp. NPDC017940 TaxID=3365017 RepID=UPI0037B78FE9
MVSPTPAVTPAPAVTPTPPTSSRRPATPRTGPSPALRKIMTRPRRPTGPRPAATRPPASRPPGRTDPRRPSPRRIPAQPPPHPAELFTELLLLVLSGQRPVHAVARHIAHTAYDDLVRLAELLPLRSVGGHRPAVQRVGHYEVRPGVFEVFARVGAGPALRALAFRLHLGDDERWRCTAVEVAGPGTQGH